MVIKKLGEILKEKIKQSNPLLMFKSKKDKEIIWPEYGLIPIKMKECFLCHKLIKYVDRVLVEFKNEETIFLHKSCEQIVLTLLKEYRRKKKKQELRGVSLKGVIFLDGLNKSEFIKLIKQGININN
tara:strand:+ start:117 stop:497 length:381 start_codon:yes stop_codon:yes gene_type:complete